MLMPLPPPAVFLPKAAYSMCRFLVLLYIVGIANNMDGKYVYGMASRQKNNN